jgi:hypothetical protein
VRLLEKTWIAVHSYYTKARYQDRFTPCVCYENNSYPRIYPDKESRQFFGNKVERIFLVFIKLLLFSRSIITIKC